MENGRKEGGGGYKQVYHLNIAFGSITIPKKKARHNKKKRKTTQKEKKEYKLDFYLARCHICLTHDGALLI